MPEARQLPINLEKEFLVPRIVCWCLNLAYLALLILGFPWIVWAMLRKGKYREGYREKFFGWVAQRDHQRPCAWFHAVSVGEVNLLAKTVAQFHRQFPEWEIVLSTTTQTGFELACRKYSDYRVFYCPLDFSWAVRRAVHRIQPCLLVLAELELWPNLIQAAREQGCCVAVVNGRLSDQSYRGYRRIRWLVARILKQIDLVAVQDENTGARFLELGARPEVVHVTGSLKYDGAETNRANPKTSQLREVAGIAEGDIVLMAGSTQHPEEAYALDIFQHLVGDYPQLRLVLVPRHRERFDEVAHLLERSEVAWSRRSELPATGAKNQHPAARILLVDTIGELGAWWGVAQIAFVGGSFGKRGGQNMLEPAAYGAAVSFGPHTRNFRDIVGALLAANAAHVVHDGAELAEFVRHCLQEPSAAQRLGQNAQRLVASQLGATRKTVDLLTVTLQRTSLKAA